MTSTEAQAEKLPAGREPTLWVVPEPADVNYVAVQDDRRPRPVSPLPPA